MSTHIIPTFEELIENFPQEFQTEHVIVRMKRAYDWESKRINDDVTMLINADKEYSAVMYRLANRGSQWIAEFFINDLGRARTDSYNWHGQNTSQWVYAGCICFDERTFKSDPLSDYVVSTHH